MKELKKKTKVRGEIEFHRKEGVGFTGCEQLGK
jgi:hypothetical protein